MLMRRDDKQTIQFLFIMHYSISEIETWLNVYSLNLGVVSLHNLKQKTICEGSDSLKNRLY